MANQPPRQDVWADGDVYEPYVGRWSRLVAQQFLAWLQIEQGAAWLDVGFGTGALSQTILQRTSPSAVTGIDRSPGYIAYAHSKTQDARVQFRTGDAQSLPVDDNGYDVAVSGLVLNFVPQPAQMVAEMRRAVRLGGVVALYVWDYGGKMQLMRHFWNAAAALDPAAVELDEGRRFPICRPSPLVSLFESAGLSQVEVRPIDIDTDFRDFDDYWSPFLGGQGPAPGYATSLSEEGRAALRERIHASLPFALDGSIPLVARVWAVRGIR